MNGEKWTEDEEVYLEYFLFENDGDIDEAVEFLGRTKIAVLTKASLLRKSLGAAYIKEPWTEKEDNIVKRFFWMTGKEMTVMLPRRTAGACRARRSTLGLAKNNKNYDERYGERIRSLAKKGYTRRQISEALLLDYNAVRQYVYTRDIPVKFDLEGKKKPYKDFFIY